MGNGTREQLPGGALVLAVTGRPGPPALRFERTDDRGRLLLGQFGRPLLLGRSTGEGCCRDLHLHRMPGHRSPLPPIRAAWTRSSTNWPHQYATWLERSPDSPLHDGRWRVIARARFSPGVWTEDFVTEWPSGRLELYCGGGWHGVLPLRPLSPPDAPRVKAYRRQAREGTLAPVLLWWVSFLDGWLILDGHDRAVAALAEGAEPACVELTRVADEGTWRRTAAEITEAHERAMRRPAGRPGDPDLVPHRAALERGYADVLSCLPYDAAGTATWPLPGGAPAWDDLAARAMFQCPRD
ncbi:hypothetical protein ACIBBD_01265 [Streptomyces sp. NPDC051315]|uniref:hypothetical protein n=1 Tax=Streptomyces sp. NPDC051315 TaxID=3365650 RepID=UPI0037AD9E7D